MLPTVWLTDTHLLAGEANYARQVWRHRDAAVGYLSQDLNHLLNHLDSKSPDSELTRTELFALRRQIKTLRDHLIPTTFLESER